MSKKEIHLRDILIILFGIFSSMPIICINLGVAYVSVFQLLFFVVLAVLLYENLKSMYIKIGANLRLYFIWLLLTLGACLFGVLFFNGKTIEWSSATQSYIPKVLLYILLCILWYNQNNFLEINRKFVKGIFWGFVCNLIWAISDTVIYYMMGISITNTLFSGYIQRNNVRYGMLSLILSNGMFRVGGFNSDPANIGFIAPVVLGYSLEKKNYILVIISILGVVCSSSTIALVCSIGVILLHLCRLRQIKVKITKKVVLFSMIFLLVAFWMINKLDLVTIIGTALNNFLNRSVNTYFNKEIFESDIRIGYLYLLPEVICRMGLKVLFGTGLGTESYGYLQPTNILNTRGISYTGAFSIENTYIEYLLNVGIVGLVLYIYILYRLIKYYKKNLKQNEENAIFYSGFISILFSGFLYHYVIFAPQVLLIISGLSQMDKIRIQEEE